MTIKLKRFEMVHFGIDADTKKNLLRVADRNHQKLSEIVRQIFYAGLKATNVDEIASQLFILDADGKGKTKALKLKDKYEKKNYIQPQTK